MNNIEASFRDPSGYVFKLNNEIYRNINEIYREHYNLFMNSGLYEKLKNKHYIVSHQEVELENNNSWKTIKPTQIPFISYPYEWSFSQLKDAALLTLKIQRIALEYNMNLKDASAYNVQFFEGKPIFIDTLSFEKYQEGSTWVGYRQFCQHFLAPLLLMSHLDIRCNLFLKDFIDGIPLDLATKMLPLNAKIKPSVLLNICMQASYQKKYENADTNFKKTANIKKKNLILMNEQLQDTVNGIKYPSSDTEWGNYYTFTNYNQEAFENKKVLVKRFIDNINPKTLWDMGANNGLFTRIASEQGISSIAFDIDPNACEKNYRQIKNNNEKNILPLLFDLTNPSPSIGWSNCERGNIFTRSKPDVIMALALIHHISISNNVPFINVAKMFSALSDNLIIEFVPKEDSQVVKLLATREDVFPNYNIENFEKDFSQYYNLIEKQQIEGTKRTLFLFKKRSIL